MKKERVVVICPGRGTYTKETLGYLKKYRPKFNEFFSVLDEKRVQAGQPTISELDNAATFTPSLHTKGEHASALIYACSYADFLNIDTEKYEVVAVTGNSMGWYIALACAQALNVHSAFTVINTMGSMMKDGIIGGQIIYPITDENWVRSEEKVKLVEKAVKESGAHHSIHLGGYAVIGGEQKSLDQVMKSLPKIENYPFQLINHAAFHTPLLKETSDRAFQILSPDLFQKPSLPLIDGQGKIWMDYATDLDAIYDYTLGHQVFATYDFTKAVSVALKEFCPDRLMLLGPGNSLGGAVGQILVENHWKNINSKADFSEVQAKDPFLISLGRA